MATAARVVGNKEFNGKGSKGNCNSNKVVGNKEGTARAARVIVMGMRMACNEEGDGKGGNRNWDGNEDCRQQRGQC
jgi:hypothetical protein